MISCAGFCTVKRADYIQRERGPKFNLKTTVVHVETRRSTIFKRSANADRIYSDKGRTGGAALSDIFFVHGDGSYIQYIQQRIDCNR